MTQTNDLPPHPGGDYNGGWFYDPIAVAEIRAVQPIGSSGDTPAANDASPLPDHVYLWDAARKVLGHLLPPRNQGQVGSCVGHGTTRAIEYTLLNEIANGSIEAFYELACEINYGLGRVEVGKGRLGRQDGCVGAWCAQAANLYGNIKRGVYGKYDLSKYTEAQCRLFGSIGCPDDIEPEAKQHLVKGITQVRNWEDAKRLMANGSAIAVSSSVGFVMQRDAEGFCKARGIWRHCMCLCGYKTGRREGGRLDNSWGPDAHTGPVGDGNPGPEGFWVDAQNLEQAISEGDSWAFSAVEGFPVNKRRWIL